MSDVTFFVPGIPQPGGSKTAFYNKHTKRVSVSEACKKNPAWRSVVVGFAMEAHKEPPLTGPLTLHVAFFMPRPRGHFGSGKNANKVKPSAPLYPTGRPDTTKLLRALEDALTGVLWVDDAQIVVQSAAKLYAEDGRVGAKVFVQRCEAGAKVA